MALPLLAFLASSGCGSGGGFAPVSPDAPGQAAEVRSSSSTSSARSGSLNIVKDCTEYHGAAGETCTITSSNLEAIPVGSVITYKTGAVPPNLDTDIVIDPPGPGNNKVFGHCTLSLATGIGTCTLSGGTGKFNHLQANVAVSNVGGANYAWNGTYRYEP